MGAMLSSPNQAIYVESLEPPISHRRLFLASKFLMKSIMFMDKFIYGEITKLSIYVLTNKYWDKKNYPPLVSAFLDYNDDEYLNVHFDRLGKLPRFMETFQINQLPVNIVIPKFCGIPLYDQKYIKNYYDNSAIQIYTDGSKSDAGVGCAFWVESSNDSYRYKLPNMISVFTSETVAIIQALEWALQHNNNNVQIITDSQSVLKGLEKYNDNSKNHLLLKILKLCGEFEANDRRICFLWTMGHNGIVGNEKVDRLAKEAATTGDILNYATFNDSSVYFKQKMRKNWVDEWGKYCESSSNHYCLIHPTIPHSIFHIDHTKTDRNFITTITRMKLNHGKFPAHLWKIGLRNTAQCDCNQGDGDLNHILFNCNNYRHEQHLLLESLVRLKINLPTSVVELLSLNNMKILRTIFNYLKNINLQI